MSETKLDFIYEGATISIYCKEDDLTKEAINKFCNKAGVNNNSIYCIYSGNPLDENKKISEIKSKNKENKISILAYQKNKEDQEKVESIVKSSQVICPDCGEIALISFQNYKIKTSCKNGHDKKNIFLDEFEKSQKIDESKINCDICKDLNKSMTFKKEFYICLSCKKNICPLCKAKHSKMHNTIVKYEQKNFICFEHEDNFGLYCKDCKINLCSACENEHTEHETVTFGKLFPNKKGSEKKMKELKDNIDKLKEQIKNIIDILNKVNENMDQYYEIINYLNNSFGIKAKNYELLKSIKDIDTSYIINDISDIIKEEKIDKKFNLIYNIYLKMTSKVNNNSEEQNNNLSDSESPKKNNNNNIRFNNKNDNSNDNNNIGMGGMNTGMDGMNTGMRKMNTGMGGMNPGMDGMNTGMGGMNTGMNGMNTGMGGMNTGMNGMNLGFGGMDMGLMGMLGMNPIMNMGISGINLGFGGMNNMSGMNTGMNNMSGMNPGMGGMNMNQNIDMDIQAYNNDKDIIKITFKTLGGFETIIYINRNLTFNELFKIYLKKIQKPNIYNKILFLLNGEKINYESKDEIRKLINAKSATIIIIDQEGLIGK